ncbi:hypothetical protein [Parapedobacter soli]|uniref:hypothetical protein n=1 Tax=Parapedobacter soli TaxID=416955 RepID=UPI0021C98D2E|nr:hypothetical protein [Parapedobacter soli]
MNFVPLTHAILRTLQGRGYNVLKSTSRWGDESPTFIPSKIEGDISEYLLKMDLRGLLNENPHFLVIKEALAIPESQLFGYVWDDEP